MQVNSVGTQYSSALKAAGPGSTADASGEFQNILTDAINAANDTDATNQQNTEALLMGDVNNLSQTMVDSQKASLALSLTVQIRNRVIDAYNEVMRMQV